jgi:hypothetical protein
MKSLISTRGKIRIFSLSIKFLLAGSGGRILSLLNGSLPLWSVTSRAILVWVIRKSPAPSFYKNIF